MSTDVGRRIAGLRASLEAERAKVKALREALAAAKGYLLNAHIDLETGAPKRTAINTLSGGIRLVREALAATSDPIEAPSDVHPTESGQ